MASKKKTTTRKKAGPTSTGDVSARSATRARGRRIESSPRVGEARRDAVLIVTDEAIAVRAYQLYLARGGAHGQDVEDWLQAEAEVRRTGSLAS